MCVIFDLDGTLVDSERHCVRALADVVPQLDLSEDELLRRFRGRKLADIFTEIERLVGRKLPESITQTYRARSTHLIAEHAEAYPGVADALELIAVPMCIASGGPPDKIRLLLEKTDLLRFFGGGIFSSYEVKSWRPAPELFLHAARAMDRRPSDCLVVEDSDVGIRAASAAGMQVVHFREAGVAPMSECSFQTYRDLPALVDRMLPARV